MTTRVSSAGSGSGRSARRLAPDRRGGAVSCGTVRRVKADSLRYPLELHRPDFAKGDWRVLGSLDHFLADQHLARACVLADAGRHVHRLAVEVALLEEDRSAV